jgi:hypothetical protein
MSIATVDEYAMFTVCRNLWRLTISFSSIYSFLRALRVLRACVLG